MRDKTSISLQIDISAHENGKTETSKISLLSELSTFDVLGISFYLVFLISSLFFFSPSTEDFSVAAGILLGSFLAGHVPAFVAAVFYGRFFRLHGRTLRVLAVVSALLMIACPLARFVSPESGWSIAACILAGLGSGCMLMLWFVRIASFSGTQLSAQTAAGNLLAAFLFLVILAIGMVGLDSIVYVALPLFTAFCFIRSTQVFSDEIPPDIVVKRPYTQKRSFVKLVLFSVAYGIAFGLFVAYLLASTIPVVLVQLACLLGFLVSGAWTLYTSFFMKRHVPTNALFLLAFFVLAGGIIMLSTDHALLLLGAIFMLVFLLLHWAQCVKKTLKSVPVFGGRFMMLFGIELLANAGGLFVGFLVGGYLVNELQLGFINTAVALWIISVLLIFVTLFAAVDEKDDAGIDAEVDSRAEDFGERKGMFREKIAAIADEYALSARQTEVLFLLAKGRNAAIIKRDLVISSNTAKSHIYAIFQKFGIHSQQELIDFVDSYEPPEES